MHFVLVHSLAVGPSTWKPVGSLLRQRGHAVDLPDLVGVARMGPPTGPRVGQRVLEEVQPADGEAIILVTHSNAGLFAPAIGAALSTKAEITYAFVDATVPPQSRSASPASDEFMSDLRPRAKDGLLPRWTEWWDAADIAPILPTDPELREAIIEEQPRLPLSFYEQIVDVPLGWDDSPCGYIYFGPPYDEIAPELTSRGWPVRHIRGQHLHMAVDPLAVANTLIEVAAALSGED